MQRWEYAKSGEVLFAHIQNAWYGNVSNSDGSKHFHSKVQALQAYGRATECLKERVARNLVTKLLHCISNRSLLIASIDDGKPFYSHVRAQKKSVLRLWVMTSTAMCWPITFIMRRWSVDMGRTMMLS